MNKSILTQILNETANPDTICKLKSTFENLDEAKHFMDDANAIPGLIGHVRAEVINDQIKYNVYLLIYNQFDTKKFKDFVEGLDSIEIVPILSKVIN